MFDNAVRRGVLLAHPSGCQVAVVLDGSEGGPSHLVDAFVVVDRGDATDARAIHLEFTAAALGSVTHEHQLGPERYDSFRVENVFGSGVGFGPFLPVGHHRIRVRATLDDPGTEFDRNDPHLELIIRDAPWLK